MPLLPTPGNRQQWARPVGHMARGRGAWGDRGRGGGRFQNYQRDDFNFEGGMNDPYDEYSGGNARGNITMGGSNMAPMGGGFNNAVDMNPQKAVELIVGLGNMLQQWVLLWTVVSLTHKQLETFGCILSLVATDALVLKHQVINSHSAV